MAQLKETLEPYVRVHEYIEETSLNPRAGEDLVVGCTIISDTGRFGPVLINGQKEFLKEFSSQNLTKEYVDSFNKLYKGSIKDTASTLFLNAYRLAGSTKLLVVRASKSKEVFSVKSLVKNDPNTYIQRDGSILKKVPSFKIVIDKQADSAEHTSDGWSINVNEVGVVGNRTTNEGAQYDYFVDDLGELVKVLNETSKFFSPDFKLYKTANASEGDVTTNAREAVSVVFNEVYLGSDFLDTTDSRCPNGLTYLVTCEKDWTSDNPSQKIVNLNDTAFSRFDQFSNYVVNKYNTTNNLKVRIRRFNHDAVVSDELDSSDTNPGGKSPYRVLEGVLNTYSENPSKEILDLDFYEFSIMDPSVSKNSEYFNVGKVLGRGDMTLTELNETINMIKLNLPEDLSELKLGYYGFATEEKKKGWVKTTEKELAGKAASATSYDTIEELKKDLSKADGDAGKVGTSYYVFSTHRTGSQVEPEEIYVNLTLDTSKTSLLDVSDTDLMNAIDEINQEETYVVEGFTDLGCTSPMFQTYLSNVAVNENYFYPISTVNSTNYLAIANSVNRISKDSPKLLLSAPWDKDTGTVGWKFYVSSSVLYWETVSRNKSLGKEFLATFGQNYGVCPYQSPVVEFNKKIRQLLLSKRINTVMWNNKIQAYTWNDNFTKTVKDNIMSSECNSRLMIRISKVMDPLLSQFKGQKISAILWKDASEVIDYWFRTVILPLDVIDGYKITIDESNNPPEVQRRNQMNVLVEVRYERDLKYIEVYNKAYDVGMPFNGKELA